MSKSRRVERLKERSQERFDKWANSNTPMSEFEGSRAQKDLKEHHRLRHKVEKIEGKIQAKETKGEDKYQKKEAKAKDQPNEKPKPTATSRPRGDNEFSGSEKINAESKKRLDEIQSQYADRMKATDVIAANAKKRRGQHITIPGLKGLKGLAGTNKS
jgi:hypothetical protein